MYYIKDKKRLALFISCMPIIHQHHLRWNITRWLSNYFSFCFTESDIVFESWKKKWWYQKPVKQWKSKKIEIHHTEDKHGNWYHTAGVKTWLAVMHWTKPSKSPCLCMETGEVKCNGLPIILYFPARATIFRHNTFFVCAHQDMAFILYVMI